MFPSFYQLPLSFEVAELQKDLMAISEDSWIGHFNEAIYSGDWSGLALRGPAGATHPIQSLFATPGTSEWEETSLLKQSPAFQQLLSSFKCALLSVRLLRLGPGTEIHPHSDHNLSMEDGEIRLHVPVQSNELVEFVLDGERLNMEEGCCYYTNVNLEHSVKNHSEKNRVHLVLDCKVNEWILEMFNPTKENDNV